MNHSVLANYYVHTACSNKSYFCTLGPLIILYYNKTWCYTVILVPATHLSAKGIDIAPPYDFKTTSYTDHVILYYTRSQRVKRISCALGQGQLHERPTVISGHLRICKHTHTHVHLFICVHRIRIIV